MNIEAIRLKVELAYMDIEAGEEKISSAKQTLELVKDMLEEE